MIITIKKSNKFLFICALVLIVLVGIHIFSLKNKSKYTLGGSLHIQTIKNKQIEKTVFKNESEPYDDERFQRPSKENALNLKYKFEPSDEKNNYTPKGYPKVYKNPKDVVESYYSILKDAANMEDYCGGCGTIGWSKIPYPYAYNLLSESYKSKMSLKEFEKSFAGNAHMTLLKLYPLSESNDNLKHYFVEIEVISGEKCVKGDKAVPTTFAYYYGIVTVENDKKEGWKIKSVHYIPEDFLCAPWHLWQWDSESLVNIIYKDWYKIIDKIDDIKVKDNIVSIYASGDDREYKFEFIRLTNGEDKLVREYVYENNKWKETNILKEKDKGYKFSTSYFNNK